MEITEVTNISYVFHGFLIQIHNILHWAMGSKLPCGGVWGQNHFSSRWIISRLSIKTHFEQKIFDFIDN